MMITFSLKIQFFSEMFKIIMEEVHLKTDFLNYFNTN